MSGSKRIIRLKPSRAAMQNLIAPLTVGLAGLLLVQTPLRADQVSWDCRMAPDGRNWQCYKDGQLVSDPDQPAAEAPIAAEPAPDQPPRIEPAEPATAEVQEPEAVPPPPAPEAEPAAAAAQEPEVVPSPPAPAVEPAPVMAQPAATEPPAAEPASVLETARPEEPETATRVAPDTPAETQPAPPAEPVGGEQALRAFDDGAMPDLLGEPEQPVETEAVSATTPAAEPVAEMRPAQPVPIAGGIDAGIDWASCQVIQDSPDIRLTPGAADAPVEVTADAAVAQFAPQQAVFSGNVLLTRGEMQMQADELVLNRETGVADARGNVVVMHPDIRISGNAASYQLETGRGQVEQASYRIVPMRARGEADHAELLGQGKSRYDNISYTTCRPGESDWLLSAEALEIDQAEGLGTADNATLRFMGVPVLYAPTFTFPIDDRRRSGLLVPSIGYSDSRGLDISVPYYLNLAENYDLTLAPRLMSNRGLMLGGEFRFLTETTHGTLAAEYLPDDSDYDGDNSHRGAASLFSHTQFNTRTTGQLRLNYVSDDDYLTDLGDSLAVTSATHLERAGELRYHADTWDVLGRVQYYQTVDDEIPDDERPYSRLPQLLLHLEDPDGIAGTSYHLAAEYVNFDRSDSMDGHRVTLWPGISLPLRKTWGFVEPKLGARYVGYDLTDPDPGIDDSASTFTGVFSLDSGLFFDRSTDWFGSGVTQTLEPRLFYLYVPEEDQDDQPVFDTGLFDFNFDNLFRENRFNGPDRIGDANQVTLALTSRLLADESGAELLRVSLGQIQYFEDREVTLPGETVADDSSSAYVAELAAKLGGGWYTRGGIQWDPHDGSGNTDQALAQLGYRDHENHVFNLAYRLRDGITEQTDVAAYWPLSEKWSLVGRHNYSLQEDRLLEALAGIEYGECCWRLRAIARKHTDGTGNDHNMSFLIQLELNGLGRFGDDIDKTLERGIYGYTTD